MTAVPSRASRTSTEPVPPPSTRSLSSTSSGHCSMLTPRRLGPSQRWCGRRSLTPDSTASRPPPSLVEGSRPRHAVPGVRARRLCGHISRMVPLHHRGDSCGHHGLASRRRSFGSHGRRIAARRRRVRSHRIRNADRNRVAGRGPLVICLRMPPRGGDLRQRPRFGRTGSRARTAGKFRRHRRHVVRRRPAGHGILRTSSSKESPSMTRSSSIPPSPARRGGPMYRLGPVGLVANEHAVFALGAARRAVGRGRRTGRREIAGTADAAQGGRSRGPTS